MPPIYSYSFTDRLRGRHPITCDSGAETPEGALKSIRRFLGRELRRRKHNKLPEFRLPRHVGDLRQWCQACGEERYLQHKCTAIEPICPDLAPVPLTDSERDALDAMVPPCAG